MEIEYNRLADFLLHQLSVHVELWDAIEYNYSKPRSSRLYLLHKTGIG